MQNVVMPLLAAASVLSACAAYADLGDQLFKLLADDGATSDHFGVAVAINPDSNGTTIIGARADDDNGGTSGSAYLFDVTTGQQIVKLLPKDGAAGDQFGHSVAINGSMAIVGASKDDDNGDRSGSAYLFDITTGRQIAKLLPNDGAVNDRFGFSVAIAGNIAVVGAIFNDDDGINSGSAYLFNTATGRQIAKLVASDAAEGDNFGFSVAISGTTAIVGAINDDDNGVLSGSAYLFDTATGEQLAKILADNGDEYQGFGWSVGISGPLGKEIAIVGTYMDDNPGPGSAYLFDISTGKQIAELFSDDGVEGDHFGFSVAISGAPGNEVAIVGAPYDEDNGTSSGSAYLFDATTGQQLAKVLPNDGAIGDLFGRSVAISGRMAVVGAFLDDDNGSNSGSAYLFDAAAPGMCPWDVDGDGVVDHHDLVAVVHNMGVCDDPDNCPWDVNGDGVVNGADVAEVARHFGPCP